MAEKLHDLRSFAEVAGVKYTTMRRYHATATKRRAEAAADPEVKLPAWLIPPPDDRVGQSPVWRDRTVRKWIESRPRAATHTTT